MQPRATAGAGSATFGRAGVGARRDRLMPRALTWLRVAVLIFGAFVMAIPILWMISTSLKDTSEIFRYPPYIVPRYLVFQNYVDAFTAAPQASNWSATANELGGFYPPLVRWTMNTLLVAGVVVVGAVFSNSLVAFGFARLRFIGRDVAFFALLATMMLPSQVTIIPIFVMFNDFGWVDTYLPLTVPSFFGSAWLTFLFRQYIMTLPLDLDDAARIDGCSTFGIFWRLILPLSRPILVTIALFAFSGVWNDYFDPLIYLTSREKWTISLGLANFTLPYGPREVFAVRL